jgi:hypothetical protein
VSRNLRETSMIAPARPSQPELPESETLRRARRVVAEMFLPQRSTAAGEVVPAWRAWLLALWMAGVLAAFVSVVVLGAWR